MADNPVVRRTAVWKGNGSVLTTSRILKACRKKFIAAGRVAERYCMEREEKGRELPSLGKLPHKRSYM